MVKIFIVKTEFSCEEICNDIRAVKAGNSIDYLINFVMTVFVKVCGENCAAEAYRKERHFVMTCLLFDHFYVIFKVISGIHRVANEVKCEEINMVFT